MTTYLEAAARLSEDGLYRYALMRRWHPTYPPVVWIMLNPSTADATEDDPTIRRVVGFSRSAGYGSAIVVNLYGLRVTRPVHLLDHPDPVGPENDGIVLSQALSSPRVVVAWGAHEMARRRGDLIGRLPADRLYCLGTTKDGAPRHPLYVKGATTLQRWPVS